MAATRKTWTFLSTLPARGATENHCRYPVQRGISIHAPREGSDDTHALPNTLASPFLSTLPARGATPMPCKICSILGNFYPRSPRGERPSSFFASGLSGPYFYPRSPRGERLFLLLLKHYHICISIHAPREGSDRS